MTRGKTPSPAASLHEQTVRQHCRALKLGCSDSAAIRYLLTCAGQQRPVLEVAEIGGLTRYDRPMPCLRGYDRLLDQDQEVVP